jgi:hypothetical protein
MAAREPTASRTRRTSSSKEKMSGRRLRPESGRDGQLGHVLDGDRLERVIARARDEEERQAAQEPGDVVHEHIFPSEDERRADDRVGKPG